MSVARYDVIFSREGKDGKKYWNRIGVAFPTDKGGISVLLDSIPAPVDGQYRMLIVEPKEKDDAPRREVPTPNLRADRAKQDPLDDEISF